MPTPEQLFHFTPPGAAAAPGASSSSSRQRSGAQPGERILITGIGGGQGRLIARRLSENFHITGVDRVPWGNRPPGISMHVLDIRKRKFEDVFRTERPDTVVHLAFVRHFRENPEKRHEVNVLGTRRVLEYAVNYGVKRVVVLSSSYVYGALPDNPYYMTEDHPLNVSRTYPEVRDLSEVDTLSSQFLWQHPEIATTILRPVNTLGVWVQSAIGRYLRQRWVPTIMGYNPMMQFVHEEDVTEAIALALTSGTHGVFNVVGPGAVPLKVACAAAGTTAVPIPETVGRGLFGALFGAGLYHTPPGALDFLKYPCTLSGKAFTQATGYRPQYQLKEIFDSVRGRR